MRFVIAHICNRQLFQIQKHNLSISHDENNISVIIQFNVNRSRCLSDVQFYTQGGYTTTIWMDDVACYGLETSLKACSHRGWGIHNCATSENVGIRCFGGCEGIVE